MNKRIMSAVTAMVMTVTAFSGAAIADAPTDRLTELGIMEGYEDGKLHLERTLTRAEFAKIFATAFLSDDDVAVLPASFSDIDSNYWASKYIGQAISAGVINGFADGTFRPEESITYEQAVKIIVQYLEKRDREYPLGYVREAVDVGILDGVTATIGADMTRGDVAYLVDNAMRYRDEEEEQIEVSYNGSYGYSSSSSGGSIAGGSYNGNASPVGSGGGGGTYAGGVVPGESSADSSYASGGYFPSYYNTEEYTAEDENVFKSALTSPLSTFSIDTDTASYSNMRRFLLNGRKPANGSIRTEELINYFAYDNPLPTDGTPFSVTTEIAECPWNSDNQLAMISVQGEELTEYQPSNLVFLLDISGSMFSANKLPLVKKSLKLLINELDERDTISIVTYASGTGVALESTPVAEKEKIIEALDVIQAGGGTYGAAGINLAYEQAEKSLIDGNNRIILCTDGDFNIGPSSTGELEEVITEKRNKGIFLTVLGFGMGNYKDNRMETLADKGTGNYAYIDSFREAKRVFVDEMPKTLYTIAKDVKIQVEFNPEIVKEYRLVGYENRVLNNEDFENDAKDAGELTSGANVTVFYEIVPADGTESADFKYQTPVTTGSDELMNIKIRYKEPTGDESILKEYPVDNVLTDKPSTNFKFAASLAELGMILNNSEYKGTSDYDSVIALAKEGIGDDKLGFRTEFLHLADLLKYTD